MKQPAMGRIVFEMVCCAVVLLGVVAGLIGRGRQHGNWILIERAMEVE